MAQFAEKHHEGVLYLFYTDHYQYFPGESIILTLLVTNTTPVETILEYPSTQYYDFAFHSGNTTIWQWSQGKFFLQVIQQKMLKPGEILCFQEKWLIPNIPTNFYQVEAKSKAITETKLELTVFVNR